MIRPATAQDIPALLAIWNPIIRDTMVTFASIPKTAQDLFSMMKDKERDGQAFLVAEHQGQVVGFACYGQFRAGNGYRHAMEHTIILGPAARGAGLGRALMARLEDHARKAGVHCMMAGVSGGNPEGAAFHAAIGFTQIARIPQVGRKFDQWWDLILMQKILT